MPVSAQPFRRALEWDLNTLHSNLSRRQFDVTTQRVFHMPIRPMHTPGKFV